jgi:hypothetical protein
MIINEKFFTEFKIIFFGYKQTRYFTEIEPNENRISMTAGKFKKRNSNSLNKDHTEMTKLNDDLKEKNKSPNVLERKSSVVRRFSMVSNGKTYSPLQKIHVVEESRSIDLGFVKSYQNNTDL